jgi:tetratricopeptide (TPR) repeat protein
MGMDDALDQVVRGEWDRDAFKVKFEEKIAVTREVMKVQPQIDKAVKAGDWNAAIITANQLSGSDPAYGYLKSGLFRTMLRKSGDFSRTYDFGRTVMRAHWDDPMILNMMAWTTVDDKDVAIRDLDFAMEAAQRANELTEEKDAAILDTVARVYFEKGDLQNAIKSQRKAVKHAGGSPMAEQLEEVLKKYEDVAESRL